ncbi:MAG: response regulator transcription factor [Pseudomonadaceae bacterium]|nr:response regulator transcription factor [Pseudomonadaceae bacterium]
MKRTRVLIVEDDAQSRAYLADIVDSVDGFRVVHQADSYRTGRQAVDCVDFELALIDIGLGDGSGLSLIRDVSKKNRRKSMVISVFGDRASVIEATRAGVDGYLLKDGDFSAVREAIQQVMAGFTPLSPVVATHLIRQLRGSAETNGENEMEALTPREHEVLALLARGYTYREVAERCGVTVNTVGFHTKQIYDKLSVHSRGEAIYKAINAGILEVGDN